MSDNLIIKKNGLFGKRWDGDQQLYLENPIQDPLQDLRTSTTIEPDVTLGDIFTMVASYPILQDLVAKYAWCGAINKFHEQAKLPRPKPEDRMDKPHTELKELVCAKHIEFGDDDFITSEDFYARAVAHDDINRYSVSYSPMNEIAHLPVVLDNKLSCSVQFRDLNIVEAIGDAVTKQEAADSPDWTYRRRKIKVDRFEVYWSLLEILDCIYYDISFMGGPEDNEAFLEEMDRRIEEIDNGTAKLIPWEDIKKDLGFDDLDDEDQIIE